MIVGQTHMLPPIERITSTSVKRGRINVLKDRGLCDRGIVPQFYGTIDQIDPKDYLPYLEMFLEDKYPPNAILLDISLTCSRWM